MPIYGAVHPMPGCCGVRVFYNLTGANPNVGRYMTAEEACAQEGINTLLATTTTRMRFIEDMLKEEGWKKINIPEPNPNTGNILNLWMYTKKDPFSPNKHQEDDEPDRDTDDNL